MPRRRFIVAFFASVLLAALPVLASDFDQRAGLGALQGLPTFFNSTTLSTTPTEATIVNASNGQAVKVKICVADGETTRVAWSIVLEGAAAPTITADFASTGASPVFPGSCEFVTLQGDRDLYVVASGADTTMSVTSFIVQ